MSGDYLLECMSEVRRVVYDGDKCIMDATIELNDYYSFACSSLSRFNLTHMWNSADDSDVNCDDNIASILPAMEALHIYTKDEKHQVAIEAFEQWGIKHGIIDTTKTEIYG